MKIRKRHIIILGLVGVLLFLSYRWTSEPSETVDLVVIGAGASGMSAALEAEAAGVNVILLEKMPYVGGNTVRATAGMNAVETEAQKEAGISDDVEIFVGDILESGHSEGNPRMIEIMARESSSALDWLTAKGADLSDVGILAGHSKPRTHRPSGGQPVGGEIVKVLKRSIDDSTVDLRLEHKAVQIMVDHDRVISGVGVVDKTGRKYTIHTKKVIIATGGFGGSPEVFVYYNQKLKGYHTTNSPSATGDFIGLVEDLDVKLVDMSYIQTHPTVSPEYGVLITEAIRGNGGILINNSGKRFANEMKNRDFLSEDLLSQPGKEVYLLFNETVRESLAASDDYINMDLIHSAPDVETLANTLRIDTHSLNETIDRYNGFVESQNDLDFGRRSLTVTLDEGPFYAVKVTPAVHYCMGGMLIDDNARIIGEDGNPISGLYAAGEATAGIHGLNRLGGNSLLDAIVFGRIAGRSAVE
ncbi:MAG: flavocytochrome c [Clostridiales bacterium]|nr:flavocytochrome c [Clostridiales bacterium]